MLTGRGAERVVGGVRIAGRRRSLFVMDRSWWRVSFRRSGPAATRARAVIAAALAAVSGLALAACSGGSGATTTTADFSRLPTDLHGPPGLVAYIADTYDQHQGFVMPVCLSTGALGPKIPVGGQPFTIVVAPDQKTAYVANSGWSGPKTQTTVTPIDLATGRALPDIEAGVGPMGIAITPDGNMAYVADMGTFALQNPNAMVDAFTVTPIRLSDHTPLKPIVVGPGVGAVTITPDGKRAMVAIDGTNAHPQSTVEFVDLATGRVGAPITVGPAPCRSP